MRGREQGLQLAGECLREAAEGRGRVLLIEGEPGIGKSATLAEVTALAGHRGFSVAAAAADELGQLMPFAPLSAALQESPADLVTGTSAAVPEFPAAGFGTIQALLQQRAAAGPALAAGVIRVAEEIARENPAFPVTTVAAAHCAGLVSGDPARLAHAAASHPDPWARASAAEDLGHLLAMTAQRADAVAQLDSALAGYGQAGASRDVARVRRRLRRLGVRRRSRAAAHRPSSGWTGLTPTEQVTANLVAQGLSNQQVAGQMYVSAHTVAYHLRQIFRKLGINSRVELARVAAEQAGRAEQPGRPGRQDELPGGLPHPQTG
jgi:DNA-binding CsgD family transcriptional regulator